MDPLTHTLVGANLASTRLADRTRLAGAALIVGANLPDVDSILYFTGHSDLALGFRRGWTHGVLALVVLPFVQTALLMLYDRMRPDPARKVDARWLFALSVLAILTHPTLDWLNNYGLRWLMPFRGTWFYGDSVYIMDPLLWLILGCGWLAARRPTPALIALWAFFSLAIAWVVGRRSTEYLAIVAVVAVILLATLLWRAPRSLAVPALALACLYIGGRLAIHAVTAQDVRHAIPEATRVMVSPQPMDPRRWDVVAETGDVYRYGRYVWGGGGLFLEPTSIPVAKPSPEWDAARRDPSIRGFITWVRFPWYEVDRSGGRTRVIVGDARYATRRGGAFGSAVVVLPRNGPWESDLH